MVHTIMIVDGFLRDLGLQSITGIRQFRKDVVTHIIIGCILKKYDLKSLRDYISIVPQNPTLFKGTIESNLKFRNKDIAVADMVKALKISQSYEFVCEKPNGFKSKVERHRA